MWHRGSDVCSFWLFMRIVESARDAFLQFLPRPRAHLHLPWTHWVPSNGVLWFEFLPKYTTLLTGHQIWKKLHNVGPTYRRMVASNDGVLWFLKNFPSTKHCKWAHIIVTVYFYLAIVFYLGHLAIWDIVGFFGISIYHVWLLFEHWGLVYNLGWSIWAIVSHGISWWQNKIEAPNIIKPSFFNAFDRTSNLKHSVVCWPSIMHFYFVQIWCPVNGVCVSEWLKMTGKISCVWPAQLTSSTRPKIAWDRKNLEIFSQTEVLR